MYMLDMNRSLVVYWYLIILRFTESIFRQYCTIVGQILIEFKSFQCATNKMIIRYKAP